jgi:hydrogenase maturation factor
MKPGDEIIATKWIALEGTVILVREEQNKLRRYFSASFLNRVKAWDEKINVSYEATLAAGMEELSYYEAGIGGIYGSLWNYAAASDVGLEITLNKIPILQETIEICEVLHLNPYQLLSGGCLLIGTAKGKQTVEKLEESGVKCRIIGKAVKGNDRMIYSKDGGRFLTPVENDELNKYFTCYL